MATNKTIIDDKNKIRENLNSSMVEYNIKYELVYLNKRYTIDLLCRTKNTDNPIYYFFSDQNNDRNIIILELNDISNITYSGSNRPTIYIESILYDSNPKTYKYVIKELENKQRDYETYKKDGRSPYTNIISKIKPLLKKIQNQQQALITITNQPQTYIPFSSMKHLTQLNSTTTSRNMNIVAGNNNSGKKLQQSTINVTNQQNNPLTNQQNNPLTRISKKVAQPSMIQRLINLSTQNSLNNLQQVISTNPRSTIPVIQNPNQNNNFAAGSIPVVTSATGTNLGEAGSSVLTANASTAKASTVTSTQPQPNNYPIFKKGNILVSITNPERIYGTVIVDNDNGKNPMITYKNLIDNEIVYIQKSHVKKQEPEEEEASIAKRKEELIPVVTSNTSATGTNLGEIASSEVGYTAAGITAEAEAGLSVKIRNKRKPQNKNAAEAALLAAAAAGSSTVSPVSPVKPVKIGNSLEESDSGSESESDISDISSDSSNDSDSDSNSDDSGEVNNVNTTNPVKIEKKSYNYFTILQKINKRFSNREKFNKVSVWFPIIDNILNNFNENKNILLTYLITKLVKYDFDKTKSNILIINIINKIKFKFSPINVTKRLNNTKQNALLSLALIMIYNKIKLYKHNNSKNKEKIEDIITLITNNGRNIINNIKIYNLFK